LKAKVRGIYTTALTKLLLENDFQIVQPSQTIRVRFGIPDNNEPPDLKIKDRVGHTRSRKGVPKDSSLFVGGCHNKKMERKRGRHI